MMTFALSRIVYFLGNILLAWATLQNKNDWVHSVIFEPQPKMQLTRSSYKITSFLDFHTFYKVFNPWIIILRIS